MKKSFTLFEIIISIIIISIVYSIAINNFNFSTKTEQKVSLENLKEFLLSQQYENSIEIKCHPDEYDCFIIIDEQIQEKKISKLFNSQPTVYKYNTNQEQVYFPTLELEKLESFDIVFKYRCTKDKKCDEYIVQTDEKVYIFNDIFTKPEKLKFLSDVDEYFENNKKEVRDAF